MTARLPVNGAKAMTGPLKLSSGTASSPSGTFASDTTSGIYPRSGGGLGLSDRGVDVGAVPIGAGMDFWGTTAPSRWVFAYGQELSKTTYAALYAALGDTYNDGEETTGNFRMPDKRDRASFGKGDMGGTSAGRITDQTGGWDGDTLGDSGGEETHTLTEAELPEITPEGAVSRPTISISGGTVAGFNSGGSGAGGTTIPIGAAAIVATSSIPIFTGTPFGSGNGHNTLPPGIVCNYIIFAGV